jgi:phage-related protein (TIGR01555 family)
LKNEIKTQYRADGYVNMLNKYGTTQDNSTAYEFRSDGIVPDMNLTEHYELNGLFAKIIDAPAEEAIKHGYNLGLKASDVTQYLDDALERLEWEEKAATAIKWSRLYGGALGVMLINDGGGIDEPLNWRRIKEIEEIRIYERAVIYPDYSSLYNFDLRDPTRSATSKFGMPEYYQVNSIYGQFWVHESRCLIFRNGIVPERTMQPFYRFWGIPEYLRIRRELRETITAHSTGVKMLERSVQAIYSMKELATLLATDEGMDIVVRRLQAIDMARGILNSIAIDNDGESYEFKTIPMAGVKDTIDTTCNMLSAVTSIPQTVLFGRSPAGQNATGKSDLENWYNYVEKIQKLQLKGNMQRLLDIIAVAGQYKGNITDKPDIRLSFNPLWSMDDEERSKVEHQNAQTRHLKAQTAQMYMDMGVLRPSEVRAGLAQDGEYQVEELIDEDDLDGSDLWNGEDVPVGDPDDPDSDGEGSGEKSGKQTNNLLETVRKYNAGEIDRDSATAIIMSAFDLDRDKAERILGEPPTEGGG